MNKVIILEGPDGAGKTQLADALVTRFAFKKVHEGPPPAGADCLLYYGEKLYRALRGKNPIVFDRFHLGELVYGPIARNEDLLTYRGMRLIRRMIQAYGVACYICLPTYETVLANWRVKFRAGDDYLRNERKLMDCYHRFKGLTAYHPQIDPWQPEDVTVLERYAAQGHRPWCNLGTIGWQGANFLVVGQEVNHPWLDLPFFSLNSSSRYLNDLLYEAGFREREMAFTNARDVNGRDRRLEKITLKMPNFKLALCLGDVARSAARKAGLPHHDFVHPSCLKRFHHHQRAQFLDNLRAVHQEVTGC